MTALYLTLLSGIFVVVAMQCFDSVSAVSSSRPWSLQAA